MDTRQKNKLQMYLTVGAVCEPAKSVWSALPAFAVQMGKFSDQVTLIQALGRTQDAGEGAADAKEQLQEQLIEQTVIVAGALAAYASVENDAALAAQSHTTPSALRALRDTDVDDRAQTLHDLATAKIAVLADYGVNAARLETLQQIITAYAQIVQSPRAKVVQRKTITEALADGFAEADRLLNDVLDKLVPQFHGKPFHDDYFNARTIVDRGGGISDPETPTSPTPGPSQKA